jgi:hypothetical protein
MNTDKRLFVTIPEPNRNISVNQCQSGRKGLSLILDVSLFETPFLHVDSGGLHLLRRAGNVWSLRLFPEAEFLNDPWRVRRDGKPVAAIHSDRPSQVRVSIPAERDVKQVLREGTPVFFTREGSWILFCTLPGTLPIHLR